MLSTIEECNEELAKLNSQLDRLTLERDHVARVLQLLYSWRTKSVPSPKRRQRPIRVTTKDFTSRSPVKNKIFQLIKDNPGSSGPQLRRKLGSGIPVSRMTAHLSEMKKAGVIENRGNRGEPGKWFIKEN